MQSFSKLKVLWIADKPIRRIRKSINLDEKAPFGGWLEGASDLILEKGEISLSYCFQSHASFEGNVDEIYYFTVPTAKVVRRKQITDYSKETFEQFSRQLKMLQPDVIQIFGTEMWFHRQFIYMLHKLGLLERTIVWIQGLTYFCSNVYTSGLSHREISSMTPWEFVRGTNISGICKRLKMNGANEVEAIRLLKNVFIRTDWDYACCKSINRNLNFYKCNETLRASFYQDKKWDINNIERHSIFVSQYGTPLKGFHQMLKALAILVREFPDVKLYTTGEDLLHPLKNHASRLKEPSYYKILRSMIKELRIEKHVVFLGTLMEDEMRDRYVISHVCVSSSSIENSPNSVGEAMILGVPIVASDVGGVGSLITHKIEGLLYPFSEYTLLAEYISHIFSNDKLAQNISCAARKRALLTHSREANYETLLLAYRTMIGKRYKKFG